MRSELGVVDVDSCQICRYLEELVCVRASHDAAKVRQHVLNRALESQRIRETVGYVKVNLREGFSLSPSPEYQFPIWLATQRYNVFEILRGECTAEKFLA